MSDSQERNTKEPSAVCGASFHYDHPGSEPCCALPKGHAGPHVSGYSPAFDLQGVQTRMSVKW